MVDEGVFEPTSGTVFLSRIFTVPRQGSSTPRLVVDLSHLN